MADEKKDVTVDEKPAQHGSVKQDGVRVPVQPVKVDGRNRRDGEDALEGHFCKVVKGEHEGRVGVFDSVLNYAKDGYPERILFVTRDDKAEALPVDYADVRATSYRGGR